MPVVAVYRERVLSCSELTENGTRTSARPSTFIPSAKTWSRNITVGGRVVFITAIPDYFTYFPPKNITKKCEPDLYNSNYNGINRGSKALPPN